MVSIENIVQSATRSLSDDDDTDTTVIFRVHRIEFLNPAHSRGQVYVRLFPTDGVEHSHASDISATQVESSSLPLKIPLSLKLPTDAPPSIKWSNGKRYNTSVRYWLGGHVLSSTLSNVTRPGIHLRVSTTHEHSENESTS